MADSLRFGIGGIPHTAKGDTAKGIAKLAELGLEHMELEFVHSVFVKEYAAASIREVAGLPHGKNITLSVHASYYVNLASPEPAKYYAAIKRVVDASYIGSLCGAVSTTYHTGFYQKQSYEELKPRVIEAMKKIIDDLRKKGSLTKISPELTGKPSQIGSLEELIDLVKTMRSEGYPEASLCIDFAHNYARYDGKYNSYDDFSSMLEQIAKELGSEALEDLHIHLSGIEHSPKGEKNHLTYLQTLEEYKGFGVEVDGIEVAWAELATNRLEKNKFAWQEVLKALKHHGVKGYVVCESPILELDALLMKKYYRGL